MCSTVDGRTSDYLFNATLVGIHLQWLTTKLSPDQVGLPTDLCWSYLPQGKPGVTSLDAGPADASPVGGASGVDCFCCHSNHGFLPTMPQYIRSPLEGWRVAPIHTVSWPKAEGILGHSPETVHLRTCRFRYLNNLQVTRKAVTARIAPCSVSRYFTDV